MSDVHLPPDDIGANWVELGKAESIPPEWLIDDLVIAGMTILGGPPKCGKSTWTYGIAAMLAGLECEVLPVWLRKVRRTGTVLVLSAEADAGEIRFTLKQLLNTEVPEDAPIMVNGAAWDFQLDGPVGADGLSVGQRRLVEWLDYWNPVATIIDPFRDYTACDENDSAVTIQALRPIRDWHKKRGAAFILVHHTGKRPYEGRETKLDPRDLRGSSALFGKADGVLMLTPRGQPNPVEVYAWFKRGAVWCRTIQPAAFGVKHATEVLEVIDEKVMRMVNAGAPGFDAIIKGTGAPRNVVEESLSRLKRNGWITKRDGAVVALRQLPSTKEK
jgi:hypothetical protein